MLETSERHFFTSVSAHCRPSHTLLDIGPGIRPQRLIAARTHLLAEPCDEYLSLLIGLHPKCVPIRADWAQALELLPAGAVDTIVLLDVIEHLTKHDGQRLLEKTVLAARSQVVVFTPLGFMPQAAEGDKDAWGLGGVDWQVHRSGWEPSDFPGWTVIACPDFHKCDAYGRELQRPHGAFAAILDKGSGAEPGLDVRIRHRSGVLARKFWGTGVGERIRVRIVTSGGKDPVA
jgi:hypothetical protein